LPALNVDHLGKGGVFTKGFFIGDKVNGFQEICLSITILAEDTIYPRSKFKNRARKIPEILRL
jgi:hypothetical protein